MATALPPLSRTTEKTCSKCKEAQSDKDDAWCKGCRSKYQQEYYAMSKWRNERRGILRGMQAMREAIAGYFRQYGGRPFMGAEVAAAVESMPGPQVAPEDAKASTSPSA